MAKKIVKRKKLKIFNWLRVLFFLGIIVLSVYFASQIRIKNLIIKNTTYLNDDDILEKGKLIDYPKFFLTSSSKTEKLIEKSPYIHDVKMHKEWGFVVTLDISENIPLFYDTTQEKYIFKNGEKVQLEPLSSTFEVPRLLNYVPDQKYSKFIKGMGRIKADTLSKISDIEYQPNDYDKDRFLLYMDDGNLVYLTLTKFRMINHYNGVLPKLDNHKGILYLDNGNHFQIKE